MGLGCFTPLASATLRAHKAKGEIFVSDFFVANTHVILRWGGWGGVDIWAGCV